MSVSSVATLKGLYDDISAMGDAAVNSDFVFQFDDFKDSWMHVVQCPMPHMTSAGEIERPGPLGMMLWQPQQARVAQQGAITLNETVAGHVEGMLLEMLTKGSQYKFNATVYDGTVKRYRRKWTFRDAFIVSDASDRAWENRSQILTVTGTLFFHYFGESEVGNISGLNNGVGGRTGY